MALPNKLKSLIDKYCMGVAPSDEQMDEIFNMAGLLNADSAEVSDYIQEMISGPTKEEREAEEKKKREAARRAKLEAQKKAEAEEKRKREAEAARKAEMEAQKKAGAERRRQEEQAEKAKRKKIRRIKWLVFISSLALFCYAFSLAINAESELYVLFACFILSIPATQIMMYFDTRREKHK